MKLLSADQNNSGRLDKRLHFPGLNGIRAYAAISVLIIHTKQNFGEMRSQQAVIKVLDILAIDAQIAVNFFLVLSGFLITYLLLFENKKTNTINIFRFYIRRILRIWPLYYLIVILCLIVLPILIKQDYPLSNFPTSKIILVILFLPNFIGSLGPLTHLWSIGLEWQFYLVWPWILQSSRRFLRVCFGILLVKSMIAPIIFSFQDKLIWSLFLSLRFECLAIGALGAYITFYDHRILKIIYSPFGQIFGILALIFLMLYDLPLTYINHLFTSVIFIVFIINSATNPDRWLNLDNKVFDALGKISYGIYMYHYPILYLTLLFLNNAGIEEGRLYSYILYSITISITLIVSMISFYWFEKKILRLKDKFAVIKTEV